MGNEPAADSESCKPAIPGIIMTRNHARRKAGNTAPAGPPLMRDSHSRTSPPAILTITEEKGEASQNDRMEPTLRGKRGEIRH